jgi:ParB family chromosome partitioning protein
MRPGYNREPWIIRRDLTKMNVAATDRARSSSAPEAYTEAGGNIIRDLFTEDRGGFFEDAALLDQLVIEKLEGIAAQVQEAEGWKWTGCHIDYPHGNGMRRAYPQPVELSEEDAAAYAAAKDEYDRLTAEWEGTDDDLPPDVDERFAELEAEIERIDAKRHAYDPDDIARGGVFVVLSHDGEARIERGFIRPEDEAPEPDEAEDGETSSTAFASMAMAKSSRTASTTRTGTTSPRSTPRTRKPEEDGKPLSDLAHPRPDRSSDAWPAPCPWRAAGHGADRRHPCARRADLLSRRGARPLPRNPSDQRAPCGHADGIEDTAAAKALEDRHAGWAADMPRDVADLWGFIAGLDHASVMALFAHCASLTVNAVKLPWERKPRAHETADRLATAVALDMTAHWTPTGADLSRARHQGAYPRRRARSRWRRGGGADRGQEEAGDGGSRRAASGRDRLASGAPAHTAARLAGHTAGGGSGTRPPGGDARRDAAP